ncbi:COX15/CtaA family protein [Pendulispora albinea]|uniref:COX15/CtaA family protein n=1 Tax=Pendulispora albinea TaxID=2741071 RepID=A0ABZ2LZH2_9BACT
MPRFAKFAWGLLAYNLLVIAWGAYVRASGSGAGCGAHWPLCNGEVLPRAPGVEMLVELSHRITSGLSLLGGLALAIAAHRTYPRGSVVRRGAWTAFGLVGAEALIGAGLVLFELVAHDKSMKRGLSMALHLTNTFFLLAALTLTAFWASGGARVSLRRQGVVAWSLGLAVAFMLVLGMSGAVTALGDTLFPVHSVSEGLLQEISTGAHIFVRLRLLHPVIATLTAVVVLLAATLARLLRPTRLVRKLSLTVSLLIVAQMIAGIANVALLAPIPMQLVHLLLADSVWIALILLAASALRAPEAHALPGPSAEGGVLSY